MDGYGYGYTYSGGYTAYNGVPPRTDEWSKTSYTSDDVHQPVFTDADGSRKPILSYTPNGNTECYVTKTEIVEVPFVTGYKQSTPVKVEVVLMDNGDVESKWNRPSSPEKWHRSSSPVRYHAEEKWNRPSSPVHELPQQVEEFITKIQTEACRPNKFSPLSATYWRQTPNPNSYHVNTGYGDQSDLSNKEGQKPSGNTFKNENYDGPYKRDNYLEPTMTTSGAWAKPSHGAWSTGQGANLSQPTNDINTAMEYLKEAVKPSSGITPPPSRNTIPASTVAKKDTYPETIDSREAQRRYDNLNLASHQMGNYTRTIDSRVAARKYGGTTV